MATDICWLECDTRETAAGEELFHCQHGQWALNDYHSKKLPYAVCNFGVAELELNQIKY